MSILPAIAARSWANEPLRFLDHRPIKPWIATRRATGVSGANLDRSLCELSSLLQ